jgi:hypothetical protein
MPENQQHGFLFEDDIKTKVFNNPPPAPYTAPHDVDRSHNPFNSNEHISLKATGRPTVDMADALRVFGYEDGIDHTCIVVQYEQREGEKVLTHVYELDLMQRELLYGRVTKQDIEELNDLVRSMPRGQRDPEIDRAITAKKKELNAKSGAMRFNPKIDGDKQRRLQCSIPKFATYPSLVKSVTTDPIVRGVRIVASIVSGRRVRNRRV